METGAVAAPINIANLELISVPGEVDCRPYVAAEAEGLVRSALLVSNRMPP